MTYTQEHLQALREALASGEHRVTYEGKSIEYRSVADLKAAIAEVEATLAREGVEPEIEDQEYERRGRQIWAEAREHGRNPGLLISDISRKRA